MRYKTLPLQECRRFAREQVAGDTPDISMGVVFAGDGEDLDMKPIRRVAKRIVRLIDDKAKDRDRIEGKAAILLYDGLAGVPLDVCDDPGFWRYLSVGLAFWDFIAWREHRALRKGDNFLKYVDGKKPTECVLPRMYMRVLALGARDDPKEQFRKLATALPSATDFWRSHVVRVQTAASPAVVRAFARMQRKRRLNTDDLREFAKEISKIRSTVVLSIYDDEEADAFIRDLRAKFDRRKAEQ